MTLRYFHPAEFSCSHCGENNMDAAFLADLDELRHRCGFPLIVSSGYRCPVHNAKVSSTGKTGPHTTGHAADFAVSHGKAVEVLTHAIAMGKFTGYGVQQKGGGRFIHLDNLPNAAGQPRPTIWSY